MIDSAFGRAQGHVQDRAVLGDVDLVAAKHGVDAVAQARLLGQVEEQPERLVGDAILGVIEEEAGGLGREPLAAAGIVGEQLAKMHDRATAGDATSSAFQAGRSRNGVVLISQFLKSMVQVGSAAV